MEIYTSKVEIDGKDYLHSIIHDITEQVNTEKALQQSQAYNRMLFEQSQMGLALADMDGKLVDINSAYAAIIGHTIKEAKQLTYWDITPEKYAIQEQEQLESLAKTGRYGPYEKEYIHKDGHLVPVRLQGLIIGREGKKYIWSSVEDISEQKKAEFNLISAKEKIEESEKKKTELLLKLNEAQHNAKIGSWEWDLSTGHVWWSDELYRIFELEPDKFTPSVEANSRYVHPDDNEAYHKEVARAIQKKEELNFDLRIISGKGNLKYCNSRAVLDFDELENPRRMSGTFADITDRKEIENALVESENKYRYLFENNPLPMWIYDLNTLAFLEVNKAAIIHYGYSKSEFESMTLKNIRPEEDLNKLLTDVADTHHNYNKAGVWRHKKKNGEIIFVEIISHLIKYDNKSARLVLANDVTDKKKAEGALLESEEQYRTLFENMNAGFVLFKVVQNERGIPIDLIIKAANGGFEKTTGLNLKDAVGRHLTAVLPGIEKDEADWIDTYSKVALSGESIQFEQGSELLGYYYSVSAFQAGPKQCAVTFVDITARKQAELELRQSEQRFRMVFEAANVGKSLTLASGEINVNQAFCDMLGYSREELQNKKWQELTPAEEVPVIEDRLKPVLNGETDSARLEKRYIHKDGSHVWADVSVRLMRDSMNRPLYFITTVTDISKQKKAIKEQLHLLNIIEKSRNEIFAFDKATLHFEFVNQGALDNLGYSLEEIKGLTPLDINPEFTQETFRNMLKPLIDGLKERQILETLHQRKNGTTYPVEVYLQLQESNSKSIFLAVINDITERKQAEEERQKSEKQFRTLFETMVQGVVYQNAGGEIISANPAAERILGLSITQLTGRTSIDPRWKAVDEKKNILPGEQHPAMVALRTGKEVTNFTQGVFNPQKKDYVWILVNSIPQFKENEKRPYQVFSTFLDITERKKAEEALSHSHELMKYIIEYNKSAVVVLDRDLKYLYVSQRYLQDYRVKSKDVTGKYHYEVFPEIPEKWRKIHQKALRGIVSRADEDVFYRKDGTVDYTRWECRPWFEADGSIGGIILYLEVINEQKRKEEEIKKLNQRLEILIESIQQLSSAQSQAMVQELVSKSARRLIGADGATLVFRENDHCFYVNEDAIQPLWKGKKFPMNSCISGWVMQNKKAVVIGDIFNDERIPQDIYRPTFVKSLAMVPINISEPIGAIGNYWKEKYTPTNTEIQLLQTLADAAARAIENIQLYTELEDRVNHRTAQLRAANKELETFTYSVSHDLKAPLRGIDGYSKLLLDEYGDSLNEEAAHFIRTIRSSTLQMNRLIDDLLSYSRLERSHFKQERIALKSFLKTLVSNYSEEIEKGGFIVEMNIPEIEIVTDSTGLSIALRNYLENAIKFTREKQNPKLEIKFSENQEAWIIAVKDNGVGFDMKYHDRIFEIFQRLHRAEDFPGTGIGLAMVAKAVQRMNGKTWAESVPGEGSTFFIQIPKTNEL